ncbi:MAG: hypothetical protein E7015_00695 [Alphaproteobacteria bacterium]|nr:hypothetical protein [Alphaproteobacteria bacterium]
MKNKVLHVVFLVGFQMAEVLAMDCCDRKRLESIARRYALSVTDGEKINADGIIKDLQFLSPDAMKNPVFSKYLREDSFDTIAAQAVNEQQKKVVEIFSQKFASDEFTDPLIKAQFCMLLDKIVTNLRPSIHINVQTHPALQVLTSNPSVLFQKMLMPSLVGPIDD